jgi:hypothetical protein
MRRREFIAVLGGAVAWPLVARAQQDRVRRIGVLHVYDENDPEGQRPVSAFTLTLADLGWTEGRNVRMDLRWGGGDDKRIGEYRHGSAPRFVSCGLAILHRVSPQAAVSSGSQPGR